MSMLQRTSFLSPSVFERSPVIASHDVPRGALFANQTVLYRILMSAIMCVPCRPSADGLGCDFRIRGPSGRQISFRSSLGWPLGWYSRAAWQRQGRIGSL